VRINEHRDKPRGLADLLLADAMVEDGIMLQADGSLLAAWSYRGPDLAAAGPDHLNALVSRLSRALKLGSGWMIHCDVIRSAVRGYMPQGAFADPVSALIDEERRAQFTGAGEQYESRYYITLTYLPPRQGEEKIIAWFSNSTSNLDDIAATHLARFKQRVDAFESVLGQINAKRLRCIKVEDGLYHDELLRYIHECITGKNHPVALPSIPIGLNDLLATESLGGGSEPQVGRKHIRVISIDGFPESSTPGILSALDELEISYRWSTRAIMLDSHQAKGLFKGEWNKWNSQIAGFWTKFRGNEHKTAANFDAYEMRDDAAAAMTEASRSLVQFGYYTGVLVLMDEDLGRLGEAVRLAQGTIQNLGFSARLEDINALEAWLGSIPGDGYCNVRRVRISSLNIADMLPLTSVWTGERQNPSPLMPPNSPALLQAITSGAAPFRLNLHVGDLGHSLVIGPSKAGKSTLLGFVMAQWLRYPGAQVFCFDWDYSQWMITKSVGGEHYDLMADESLGFCPLLTLESESDIAWAAQWVEDLCGLGGMEVRPNDRNLINDAVKAMARSRHRTLTHLLAEVQSAEVKEALQHYTLLGPAGRLLDATHDSLGPDARFVCFETKALMESADAKLLLPALLYLFRRIEKRLDGSPTLIVLDEAWSYLAHELFCSKIGTWLLTLRRRNAAVVMATQEVTHITDSPISSTIKNQTATSIYLPNPEAFKSATGYRQMGLNDQEISLLHHATPKREYYAVSPQGRRMIDLVLGQVALSFVAVSSPRDRGVVERVMQLDTENWRANWLRNRGLHDWARYLEGQEEMLCATA
jgi:type IV secretion system protein VirB4